MGSRRSSAGSERHVCSECALVRNRELRRELREKPRDDSVSDRRAVNIAPLQLGEEVCWIHSARLDEVEEPPRVSADR